MFKGTTIRALVALLALVLAAHAGPQRKQQKKADKPERARKSKTEAVVAGPVTVSNETINGAAYLPGEVKVIVKGDQNPVVRIGMAQTGVTLVEFPEDDKFFAVHPPENGDLVRVEKSPSMKADHHLVLRAGQDLANAVTPAASVTVQMRSGLNVILWIYPVKLVTQQTHRCVFAYERADIVAARQKAGLAVNLGEDAEAQAASIAAAAPAPAPVPSPPIEENLPSPAKTTADPEPGGSGQKSGGAEKSEDTGLSESVKKALKDAIADSKSFKYWSSPTNGLSVSSRARDLDEQTRVALVAVKNVEDLPLQIMAGHPELVIETLNEKGKIIQLSQVKKRLEEASTKSNVIPAHATVYYAIAFAPPILGKQQRMRVTVGQKNAADDPAGANLTAGIK
ncbi:MAG: hypothetical protein MOB07_14015 [Acidobacteria bacterium]|nr:hypothetical protein [Acidobacteriota bacterium]